MYAVTDNDEFIWYLQQIPRSYLLIIMDYAVDNFEMMQQSHTYATMSHV